MHCGKGLGLSAPKFGSSKSLSVLLKLVIFDQSISLCGFRQKDFKIKITKRLQSFIKNICEEFQHSISDQFAQTYAEKCYNIHNKFSKLYSGLNKTPSEVDNKNDYCTDCNTFLQTVFPLLCKECNPKISNKLFAEIPDKSNVSMLDKSTYINR